MGSAIAPVKKLWEQIGLPETPFKVIEIPPADSTELTEWELYLDDETSDPSVIVMEAPDGASYDAQHLMSVVSRLPVLMTNIFRAFEALEQNYRQQKRVAFISRILLETSEKMGINSNSWRYVLGLNEFGEFDKFDEEKSRKDDN